MTAPSVRFLVFILVMAAARPVLGDDVRLRVWLEPADPVYVGQQLRLMVHLEIDTWFTTAPRYPEIRVPGAIVLQPESFGVNSTRREGGITWVGQKQRYLVFPQRAGTLRIPSFRITFARAAGGVPGALVTLATPPLETRVAMPPGTESLPGFITTTRLEVTESWEGSGEPLRVGDALTRTVTQTARGTFALLLVPAAFPEPEGVTAYPEPPVLADTANRGAYSARRTDSVTYILQAEGRVVLPALRFYWFHPETKALREALLPKRVLRVAANPDARLGGAADVSAEGAVEDALARIAGWLTEHRIPLTVLLALTGLGVLGWRAGAAALRARWRSWRAERLRGQGSDFRRVLTAARRRDADAFVRAFWAWADRLPGRGEPFTLAGLGLKGALPDPWRAFLARRYSAPAETPAPLPAGAARQVRCLRRRLTGKRRERTGDPRALNP